MEISKFTIFHGNFMIPWRESDYAIFRGIAESRNAKVFMNNNTNNNTMLTSANSNSINVTSEI